MGQHFPKHQSFTIAAPRNDWQTKSCYGLRRGYWCTHPLVQEGPRCPALKMYLMQKLHSHNIQSWRSFFVSVQDVSCAVSPLFCLYLFTRINRSEQIAVFLLMAQNNWDQRKPMPRHRSESVYDSRVIILWAHQLKPCGDRLWKWNESNVTGRLKHSSCQCGAARWSPLKAEVIQESNVMERLKRSSVSVALPGKYEVCQRFITQVT